MGYSNVFKGIAIPSLLILLTITPCPAEPQTDQKLDEVDVKQVQRKVQERLKEMLDSYNGILIPGLPTIVIPGDKISVSLSLANLYLEGLTDYKPSVLPGWKQLDLGVLFPKISLLVGSYTSSGHLLNIPFSGEGPMYIHLYNLKASVSMKTTVVFCPKYNTTSYTLDLDHMETHFENLNTGTDLGQLAGIVVSSIGLDIVRILQNLLETKWYYVVDPFIVDTVGDFIGICGKKSDIDTITADTFMTMMETIIKQMTP